MDPAFSIQNVGLFWCQKKTKAAKAPLMASAICWKRARRSSLESGQVSSGPQAEPWKKPNWQMPWGPQGPHLQLGWKSCGLFQSHGHIQQKLRGRPGTEGLYTFGVNLRGGKKHHEEWGDHQWMGKLGFRQKKYNKYNQVKRWSTKKYSLDQRQIGILWPTENVDFIIEINKKGI